MILAPSSVSSFKPSLNSEAGFSSDMQSFNAHELLQNCQIYVCDDRL